MVIFLFITVILLCGTFFMYGHDDCTHPCGKCESCNYYDGFDSPFCVKFGQDPKFCSECKAKQ